jgi:hypothetical protein
LFYIYLLFYIPEKDHKTILNYLIEQSANTELADREHLEIISNFSIESAPYNISLTIHKEEEKLYYKLYDKISDTYKEDLNEIMNIISNKLF